MSDVYEELLNIVKQESDLEEFLTSQDKWEYLYNLSSIRRNVIEWYDFNPEAELLEIGAECGALTGLFCERVKSVVALEEDERKSKINEARNKKHNNLKIETVSSYSNQLSDEGSKKYDYVTIIGNFSEEKVVFAASKLN
ncbi:MAG: rRNA adenine N-6-methyltransferase family protein, partial [Eubacterium sp.]|nr:rRNA adenine N-6-methyltransferase family protein [Eubacterium sp.]